MAAGMQITPDLAAPIVERAMAILHRNINIMNAEGTIVGSGDPSRVGNFHTGAAAVLKTGRRLEIGTEDTPRWPGVRPGVNLPLRVDSQIVGVVGITGDPDEVRHYGELLREMVQLMLIQARTAESELASALAREACLRDLLTGTGDLSDRLLREARLIGLSELDTYRVLLCQPARTAEPGDYAWVEASAIRAEQVGAAAGVRPFLVTGPWEGRLVIVAGDEAGVLAGPLYEACGLHMAVAEGLPQRGIAGLRRSYQTALLALKAGLRLGGPGVLSAEGLRMETMLAGIAPEDADEFCRTMLTRLPAAGSRQGEALRQTLESFLRSGMSQAGAAELLGIHRHTLTYRLDQIAEATGYDPRTWDGALRLDLALLLERLFGQNGQS